VNQQAQEKEQEEHKLICVCVCVCVVSSFYSGFNVKGTQVRSY
jgi:hypothetical protein